jgi:nitrite reductase/ring-hydroxylating ferredoxin subunit/Fe-S cluster biogenesis protein NfuA
MDALHAEAFRRIIATLRADPNAVPALKEAVRDELVYAVLRHHELVKPSLQERVEAALDGVRPMLASHGGDVRLVRVIPPAAIEVRFTGACESCPASVTTFTLGVKKALEAQCPEITDVRQVKGLSSAPSAGGVRYVSPFATNDADGWIPAGTLADIPEDGVRYAVVDGESVVLARSGDGVSCFQNACAHLGLPLSGGIVAAGTIACPHHGFVYELASGECLTARGVQLRVHAVRVVGNDVHVRRSA